jgi:4-aminobutyrate aminotransferase-like enzyme
VACAAGLAVVETLTGAEDGGAGVLENCRTQGAYFLDRLQALMAKHPAIRQVRGRGLILGAELDREGAAVVEGCLREGLVINCTVGRVLRFLPPLTVSREEIDEGLAILDRVLDGGAGR